jgi:hypothetical protein
MPHQMVFIGKNGCGQNPLFYLRKGSRADLACACAGHRFSLQSLAAEATTRYPLCFVL